MNHLENNGDKFRFFYQHLSSDIENTKKRQWSIPYYILLLFAAIIGVDSLPGPTDKDVWRYFLCAAAIPITLVGLWHIIDVHLNQVRYRRKIYKLENLNLSFT